MNSIIILIFFIIKCYLFYYNKSFFKIFSYDGFVINFNNLFYIEIQRYIKKFIPN